MDLPSIVTTHREALSPSERKVAEVLLREPEHIAFGTLAQVAHRTATSGTTVLRLANKLGFDGFGALQSQVQSDLAHRLRPARQKIRETSPSDMLNRTLTQEISNLQATFAEVDRGNFENEAKLIANCKGRVFILAGDCLAGIGALISDRLSQVRDGVVLVDGNAVRIGKLLRSACRDDVALVIDQRRYDQFLLRALDILSSGNTHIIAFSDSPLSPIAAPAQASFIVSAEGHGPFDSQVANLALGQALVARVAVHLIPTATARLDSEENNWNVLQALTEDF
jgi:DNA-binding MurR/RpiR family transcriptional regulator